MTHKRLGYTLIEILLVIGLLGLLSAFIITLYRDMVKETRRQKVEMSMEANILILQNYLRKLLSSIGFGVEAEKLKEIENLQCSHTLSDFNATNGTVGVASDCTTAEGVTYDKLFFRSLYAGGERRAGCWWICNPKGISSMSLDKWGNLCEISTGDECKILGPNKENFGVGSCEAASPCTEIRYYFFWGEEEVFTLYLEGYDLSDSMGKRCAPKTAKLMLAGEKTQPTPIFDCLGGLRFNLLKNDGKTFLRMCLLAQVSGRRDAKEGVPLSSNCGSFTKGDEEWEHYRWRVIEEIFPLMNL